MEKIKWVRDRLDYFVGTGVGVLTVEQLVELRDALREGVIEAYEEFGDELLEETARGWRVNETYHRGS